MGRAFLRTVAALDLRCFSATIRVPFTSLLPAVAYGFGMSKKQLIIGAILGGVVVVLGAAWWLGFFSDTPEEATIEAAAEAVSTSEPETATEEAAEADDADAPASTDASDAGITGEWTVQPNEDATFVGYRINEVLTTIGDFEVVGRTSDVSGTLVADGTTITDVTVVAQMTTLTTDNSNRDNAMRGQALETEQFPEATFVLGTPIELGEIPDDGVTIEATATGDLTIHGVTQTVDFPLEAQIVGDAIVVVGQLRIQLADFDIEAPSAPIVASVEDNALLELSVVLAR